MAIPRSVDLSEPGDIDALYMYTENDKQISIARCPDDDNFISMVAAGCAHGGVSNVSQIVLNKKEAILIADALTKTCIEME